MDPLSAAAVVPSQLTPVLRYRAAFTSVDTYCSFVGYGRSGSSLVGSLLDAHPEVVIAHEVHALRLVHARVPRPLLYARILREDAKFTAAGRTWTGYNYEVPGQWQGRFERLRVIGDKKAGRTTNRLRRYPHLLDRLRSTVRNQLRFVHVTRNPFDNIATMATKAGHSLQETSDHYFELSKTVARLEGELAPHELCHVRHEDLVRAPIEVLSELCRFLGVLPSERYLEDCAGIVFASPHRSRTEVDWDPRLVEEIHARIDDVGFLAGYSLES